ncbi:thermonuclease family protein [Agrobacterium fabrum]|uniref:thermonuclease family protein n=1 Tax=Agrobacterium fabrum TaxID=1176649 RepID=UPI0021584B5A|nr:thermonuclease family protein [Agrobacterium fabrum]MCR6727700.1 thermonuclease family protein [Agrobacterium fabrum]
MLISMITASGFYAGIVILPMLAGNEFPQMQTPRAPAFPVQATQAGSPVTKDAELAPSSAFVPFPTHAQFETGDSWVSDGRRYRLFGLQACLRGTAVTVSQGTSRDCGELNVIMMQALVKDAKPLCTNIQMIDQNNVIVACQTTAGEHRYDFATYLIAQGWGFAAVDSTGQLIVPGYRVAEESARTARAGLWAYPDMPHPVTVLMQQAGVSR